MRLATKVYEEAAKANQANEASDTAEENNKDSKKDEDVAEANYEEK